MQLLSHTSLCLAELLLFSQHLPLYAFAVLSYIMPQHNLLSFIGYVKYSVTLFPILSLFNLHSRQSFANEIPKVIQNG
jgi:hypothetical protein